MTVLIHVGNFESKVSTYRRQNVLNRADDAAAFGVHLHVPEYDKQCRCVSWESTFWCHKSQLIYAAGPFVSAKIYE